MAPICKVFSATMFADREPLGERITEWLAQTGAVISTCAIALSSDNEFHCLSFSLVGVKAGGKPVTGSGRIRAPGPTLNGPRWFKRVRVFASTKANERERMGERVEEWMIANSLAAEDCEIIVLQSSDAEFHCLAWVVLS